LDVQAYSVAAWSCVIVIYVSAELGWRTISALWNGIHGAGEKIEMVAASLPGVVGAMPSASALPRAYFINMHVTMDEVSP